MKITYKQITEAVKKDPECNGVYKISAVGGLKTAITAAVNQGIDAHLEGLTSSKFDQSASRLECRISAKDLPVLLRRLQEMADDGKLEQDEESIVSDILGTLGVEVESECFEIVSPTDE